MRTKTPLSTGDKLMRVLLFTLIISMMSGLMFNIVLPEISEEFHLGIAQVSWLSSAYFLIYAIGTVTYGKLADSYKLKHLLTFGLLVFAAGSLVGLASDTFWMALAGRCMQAIGAASIPATAMLIPVRYFPPERRGSALGMTAVGLALGNALGPVISSLIVSVAHWRWLFAVPLLILMTLPFYRKYLQEEQEGTPGSFDWLGGGLLGISVALLLLGVTNGSWLQLLSGVIFLGLFAVRVNAASAPFIQPKLFRNKRYTLGITVAFLINGIGFSFYFLSPLLLSKVQALHPGWIGFAMVPAALASAILGRTGGRLADLRGNSYLFFIASGGLLLSFILLSTFTGGSAYLIAVFLIFGNVGQSFMLIALSNSISRTLPREQVGVGMGMMSMLNFIAGGMATGIYSRVVGFGAGLPWNPANPDSNGSVYSNIYLILAILHVLILVFYYMQFGETKRTALQTES